ncbi:MAG: hypothetical protein PSY12_08425 [bacterium]|nr:hypothetical protein [bacterium]
MAFVMRAIGLLLILMGLLWFGQGAGFIHWPESSFMLDQRPWIWRGLALAAVGVAVTILAGRRRR